MTRGRWIAGLLVAVLAGAGLIAGCLSWRSGPAAVRQSVPVYPLGASWLQVAATALEPQLVRLAKIRNWGVALRIVPSDGLLTLLLSVCGAEAPGRLSCGWRSWRLEVHVASGGFWLADEERLWDADTRPNRLPPDGNEALAALAEHAPLAYWLLSIDPDQHFQDRIGQTTVDVYDRRAGETEKRIDRYALDVQAIRAFLVSGPDGKATEQIGAAGELHLTLDPDGRLVAFSGLWRPPGAPTEEELVPKDDVLKEFRGRMARAYTKRPGIEVSKDPNDEIGPYLAYAMEAPSARQTTLRPVWVYGTQLLVGRDEIRTRPMMLPATQVVLKEQEPQPLWTPRPDDSDQRPKPGPDERTKDQVREREAATVWISLSEPLSQSNRDQFSFQNARGFLKALEADDPNWQIGFDWGDHSAWTTDFRSRDSLWADSVDLLFYTGHASPFGWVLVERPPDYGSYLSALHGADLPDNEGEVHDLDGTRWGDQDLEWVVIGACGPLQDDRSSDPDYDLFDRWGDAFDGLHQILGYASLSVGTEDEGSSFARYALGGATVVHAWFRAARETQPSALWAHAKHAGTVAAVMYAYKPWDPNDPDPNAPASAPTPPPMRGPPCMSRHRSPLRDHLWGHGCVAEDPNQPTRFVVMRTNT